MSPSCLRSAADASVKVVAAGSDALRQRHGAQSIPSDGRLADEHRARAQQRHDQRCEFRRESPAGREVAGRWVEVGKRYPTRKPFASRSQSIAHVAEEEEFVGRHAVGMRSEPALADVDFPLWKELAKMVIGPAVAEPELEQLSVQFPDKIGRQIEAGALRLQPADKAVETAHDRSGGDAGSFAQTFDLGKRAAELIVRRLDPMRQLLHDRDRHAREFPHHAHERLLRDAQGDHTVLGADRRCPWRVG